MKRQEKEQVVAQLRQDLSHAPAAFIVEYKGMTVGSLHALRNVLRERGAKLRVVKNTLLLRAVEGTGNDALKGLVGGAIAVAYPTGKEVAALAKELAAFAKKESFLVLRGGVLTGKRVAGSEIEEIATLPSLEVMRAKMLGLLNGPAERFLSTLLAAPRNFLGVLQAKVDKGESATN